MTQKIISQASISSEQLYTELKRIKDRDKELGFRAQKTFDYLENIKPVSAEKAQKLFDKLLKLEVPRLREMHFHKLIDIMPKTVKDVKVALQGYNLTITQENC